MSRSSSKDKPRRLTTSGLNYHSRRRECREWKDCMSKIRARAPLRVSYAGGGTDVPPYPGLKGGVVLSSTIQNYAYCSITPRSDELVTISREDQDVSTGPGRLGELKASGDVELAQAVRKRPGDEQGFDADRRNDASPDTGPGLSSTM